MSATFGDLLAAGAVNPVPWARSQMAFTLAFHIVLVPLGVSWAFMTLIANYRAVRHNDDFELEAVEIVRRIMVEDVLQHL